MSKQKIFLSLLIFTAIVRPQNRQWDAGELQIAVNKLSVLGSVLYVAAHPDDENTALLSYFAKGKLFRTAYLSITRGEGGQNLIGSELGAELGVIRTQELLAARRVDGAEQFFTRAIDFGFSKSSDEALRMWNKDSVLKDVVWVIRKFRPDIIITRFTPTQGGHGHHLASAILAEEAFAISGDKNIFPEQLAYVQPWKAKRLLFNQFRFGGNNPNPQNVPTLKADVGEYNPLLGKSYTELAGISRSMHKSQAMGSAQNRGSAVNEFIVTAGEPAKNDLFENIDVSWIRIPNGKKIQQMIAEVQKNFSTSKPEKSISALVKILRELHTLGGDPFITAKREEIESLIKMCAGLWIEARAGNTMYSRGDSIGITLSLLNRSTAQISVASAFSPELDLKKESKQSLKYNEQFQTQFSSVIRSDEMFSQPYWLTESPSHNRYSVGDQRKIGIAENPATLYVAVSVLVENEPMVFTVPVQYKWIDDLDGEKIRNVEIIPPVSVALEEKNMVWYDRSPKQVTVRLRALRDSVSGIVSLKNPEGWKVASGKTFSIPKKDSEAELDFSVEPDSSARSGEIAAVAKVGGESYGSTVKHIIHEHIPIQPVMVSAKSHLLKFDLQKRGTTVGYIMGAGDEVFDALKQMGYSVSLVTDEEIRTGDLTKYSAIVAGIRAYNVREQLRNSNGRLMNYVRNGGTFVVQYQVLERGQTDSIAPYGMSISRDRVTDETAEMKFINPNHPLLNYPNKITASDFDRWVQERGLYFSNRWDPKFETILSSADPNEKASEGSLLYTKYGKGHYIFTGLSFFRQLPAGVEGAYRLFANLVSAGN